MKNPVFERTVMVVVMSTGGYGFMASKGKMEYQGTIEGMAFDIPMSELSISTVRGGGKWESRFKGWERGRDGSCGWNWIQGHEEEKGRKFQNKD